MFLERTPSSPSLMPGGGVGTGLAAPGNSIGGERLRWRKDTFPWKQHHHHQQQMPQNCNQQQQSEGDRSSAIQDIQPDPQVEAHLASEVTMLILDTLENIVQVSFIL